MEKDDTLNFSVIVCCYNPNLNKLKKTIVSILKQKDVTFEIIICDDGSHILYFDELKMWLDDIKCEVPIQFSILKSNVGTIKNILNGLKIARGKYIKLISPGDYLYNCYTLCNINNAFIEKKCELVYGDAIYYNERQIVKKHEISHNKIMYNTKHVKDNFCLYGGYFLGATISCKKDFILYALQKIEDKVIYMEDQVIIFVALLESRKYYGIKKPLIWYEYGTGISTSKKRDDRLINDEKKLLEYIKENYKTKYVNRILKKRSFVSNNYLFKAFYFLIFFPGFYFNLIMRFFYGYLDQNIEISKMDEIINI